jgi:small subunit ribosomal protein S20
MSTTRTYIKAVRAAIDSGNAEAAREALPKAVNALNASVTKGVIHRNQAARKISRLTKAVNAL